MKKERGKTKEGIELIRMLADARGVVMEDRTRG